jgi:biopolymer transport protein ExbD
MNLDNTDVIATSTHDRQTNDDNLIPLINVVFLMLIFFMVAGHIEASDGVEVAPPSSVNEKELIAKPVTIVASQDGQLYTNGEAISDIELTTVLKQQLASLTSSETFSLQLKADGSLTVERLQDILLLIKSSGIQHISLVTQSLEQLER